MPSLLNSRMVTKKKILAIQCFYAYQIMTLSNVHIVCCHAVRNNIVHCTNIFKYCLFGTNKNLAG